MHSYFEHCHTDQSICDALRQTIRQLHKPEMGQPEYLSVRPSPDDHRAFIVYIERWNEVKGKGARYSWATFQVGLEEIWQASGMGGRWLHNLIRERLRKAVEDFQTLPFEAEEPAKPSKKKTDQVPVSV